MVGLSILGGLVDKILPAATNLIDELHTSGEEKAAAKQKLEELLVSAEAEAEKEVTARWEADLKSGNWLAANIRQLTLEFLKSVFSFLAVFKPLFVIPFFSSFPTYLFTVYHIVSNTN